MGKYETPEYKVLIKENPFQLRNYSNFFIVEYENTADAEDNNAFRTLFKYISDDNKENEKMSMTIPVIQEQTNVTKKMAFVVPEKYSDHIPEPNNPYLKAKKFEEGLFASVKYSGLSNSSKEAKMRNKLDEWVQEKGYQKESNYMVAVYNGPFTLPILRRNEIWVRVSVE